MNKKALFLPELRKQNIITSYAQIRPHREGGFRIQKQVIKEKLIFHNYGHAGSGISLSYGSAYKVVNLFQKQVKQQKKQCAVIGSGIIGMLTAFELKQRGYQVKLYSKKLPVFGQKNNKLLITSQVAPGFWFPYDYLDLENVPVFELAQLTMKFLKQAIHKNKYKALKISKVYDQVYYRQIIKKFEPILLQKCNQVQIDFGSGTLQKFNEFSTVKIDMQLWLKQLVEQLTQKGVQFIQKDFKNQKQILSIKQEIIFNCTGYGSKYLFGDDKMRAYRGHIIQFANSLPSIFDFIFGTKFNGQIVRIYCHQSRILLGLSKQESEQISVDQNIVNKLIKNYSQYLVKWTIPQSKL